MMFLSLKECISLLSCSLTLSRAAPSPPILPLSTLNVSDAENSFLNSTFAAVIPNQFKIIPTVPLDEPVLDRRYTLSLTLQALGRLALLDDFDGIQQSHSWRSLRHVSIDVVGPSKVVESFLERRKYAAWGVYKAIHLMVVSNDFRPRNYELYWQGALVGWAGFNNGPPDALGIGGSSKNRTGHDWTNGSLSVISDDSSNALTEDLANEHIAFGFELYGHTIGESNVFMTLFTGILKAALYPTNERIDDFFVSSRAFNSFLSFKGEEYIGPEGPFFEYGHLVKLFMQLPTWVAGHGGEWTEADMVVSVDESVVGAGVLKWQVGQGTPGADDSSVSAS